MTYCLLENCLGGLTRVLYVGDLSDCRRVGAQMHKRGIDCVIAMILEDGGDHDA